MDKLENATAALAASLTKSASKQSYYTIRFLADRARAADAFRAYGYFRWVDDAVDAQAGSKTEKLAFIARQQALLETWSRGETAGVVYAPEEILRDLIRHDTEKNSGLRMYLRHMMQVMAFDAARRGEIISQTELSEYSRHLATALTEAIYYFIGHDTPSPLHSARYLSVTAAHITHMLRDAYEDVAAGYFNIPREYLQAHSIAPQAIESRAYCEWVYARVHLAREYFAAGRECLAQVKNWRCRMAGYAYTARFEWMLGAIERDHYCLRAAYPERKSIHAGLWMLGSTFASLIESPQTRAKHHSAR